MKQAYLLCILLICSIAQVAVGLSLKNQAIEFDFTNVDTKNILKEVTKTLNLADLNKEQLDVLFNSVSDNIPLVDSLMNPSFTFGQTFSGCYDFFLSQVCYTFTWQMRLGWKVSPESVDFERVALTYIPYAIMEISGTSTSHTEFFKGDLAASSAVLNISLPTAFELNLDTNSFCYDTKYVTYPPGPLVTAKTEVLSCLQDVKEASRTGELNIQCAFGSPLGLTLFNNTMVEPDTTDVIPKTCWGFNNFVN
eukprot:CAMPEP_0196994234 /NCGR_PEP_ID=MMETSP1380-20130617/562_1 /TAXON_ID=5936 /ORGANISM="Euplotes crassus, Strain CT5" /LENGTH=250 /DNA_ID=CAMNT_0042409557 /DNA_START=14 /DNA_END=766 /DNA_ORIENTATION=+